MDHNKVELDHDNFNLIVDQFKNCGCFYVEIKIYNIALNTNLKVKIIPKMYATEYKFILRWNEYFLGCERLFGVAWG